MSWYEFLLFVHVTCAAIWLGGAFIFQIYAQVVVRGGDAHEIGRFAGRAGLIGERVFVPASLLVVLAGIGLMIEGSWEWGQLWVVYALVIFGASFLTGLLHIAPLAKSIPVAGPETAEGQASIAKLFRHLRVDLLFMYGIVFAMTVKPTTDDVWVSLVAAAVLVAGTAVFLTRTPPAISGESPAVVEPA
jgi:uncharacterized membrane protein